MRALRLKQPSVLPGFGLTLGFTLTYLGLIVLIPLGALVLERRGRRRRGLAVARLAPGARGLPRQLRHRASPRRRSMPSSA